MKTREEIIHAMCITYRHDYGLTKIEECNISCGVTIEEKTRIWNTMAQIFDNDIQPILTELEKRINT